ncbi:MAG: TRAP transporter small permease [Gammaproteobacteria bacterium]|nr:TRAP transporter small permease [Gammaproteobacteria bacterium]
MRFGPGAIGRASDALLGGAAAIILFGMMALTFVDVFMRYIVGDSIRGSFEITELMMVILIFAGLPLVSRKDEHVTVDLVEHLFPLAVRKVLRVVAHLVCAAMLLGMSWLMWRKAGEVVGYGDVTAALRVVLWPYVYFMSALAFVTALIHVLKAFRLPDDLG